MREQFGFSGHEARKLPSEAFAVMLQAASSQPNMSSAIEAVEQLTDSHRESFEAMLMNVEGDVLQILADSDIEVI